MRLLYSIWLMVVTLSGFTQIVSEDLIIAKVDSLVADFDIARTVENSIDNSQHWNTLFQNKMVEQDSLTAAVLKWQQKELQADWGFILNTGIANYERFGNEDINSTLRLKVGLEWNLLSGGWKENNRKVQLLEIDELISNIQNQRVSKHQNYPFRYYQIIYQFNSEKMRILTQYLMLLNEVDRLYRHSSALHYFNQSEWLEQKSKLTKYNLLLSNILDYNMQPVFKPTQTASINALPVYMVDIHAILNLNQLPAQLDSITILEKQKLEMDHPKLKKWQLKAYGSYNFRFKNAESNYSNIGLSLRIPLVFNRKRQNNRIEIQQQLMQQETRLEKKNIRKEILIQYYEYADKLKQYIQMRDQKYRLEKQILLHKAIANTDNNLVSSFDALTLIQAHYETDFELVSLKSQLYLILLKIDHHTQGIELANHLSILKDNNRFSKQNIILKLKANDFIAHSPMWIMDYLQKLGIYRLAVNSAIDEKILIQLQKRGFMVSTKTEESQTKTTPTISPSQFIDMYHFERYIALKQDLMVENLSDLIELEMQSLKYTQATNSKNYSHEKF
ncbi:hypothetical protein EMN47_13900 [Prolixibacteraceae bacterium JC049]|nr:hypothetical protein [Prolixibacteraceae bacterium JC049]